MPICVIDSLDDRRLDAYRNLKAGQRRDEGGFVAEGEKLVARLLASRCRVESILCNRAALARLTPRLAPETLVYIAETALISRLVGFRFHRGVLARGRRPEAVALPELLAGPPGSSATAPGLVLLCPAINDPENLGTIIRTAAAFGAGAVLVGPSGADPYSRRVLRTSMGAVLHLPIISVQDWPAAVQQLHLHDWQTIAAVVDPNATPVARAARPRRVALLLGNEDAGLPADLAQRCAQRVTLPMAGGVGSLNVAVAAGILLHHFSPHAPPHSG